MDHVLESIEVFYEVYLDEFLEEHKCGQYEKLSNNPCYKELKTIIDSMNILRKYLGYENIKLSEVVKLHMQEER